MHKKTTFLLPYFLISHKLHRKQGACTLDVNTTYVLLAQSAGFRGDGKTEMKNFTQPGVLQLM